MSNRKVEVTVNKQALLDRALAAGCAARLITQVRGDMHRISKTEGVGQTYSPQRVIVIDGKSFSFGGARQYLAAVEKRLVNTQ